MDEKLSCSIFDVSDNGVLQLEGKDAVPFLHRISTNHVEGLAVGDVQWNALLDRKGRVLSLFQLAKRSDDLIQLLAPKEILKKTHTLISKMIFSEQITIIEKTGDEKLFILIGATTPELLDAQHGFSWQEDLFGMPMRYLLTSEFSGEIPRISPATFELLRIQANIPKYGVDITEENLLLEGNLAHAYARRKGCYPGQEVIERLLSYAEGKTPNLITNASFPGRRNFSGKESIQNAQGEKRGVVTSAQYHPLEDRTFMMVLVKRKSVRTGESLFLEDIQCELSFPQSSLEFHG